MTRFSLLLACLLCGPLAAQTTIVDDDFSVDSSADYPNGVNPTISGGVAAPNNDGFVVYMTDMGTGDAWLAIDILLSRTSYMVVIGTDASGNGAGMVFSTSTANGVVTLATRYTTYTTYATLDDNFADVSLGAFADGTRLGVTIDKTNEVIRFWNAPVAAQPDSVTSWDSGAADGSVDLTTLTNTTSVPGDFVGFGTWDTTSPTDSFDNFSAGNFSAGGGSVVPVILQQH